MNGGTVPAVEEFELRFTLYSDFGFLFLLTESNRTPHRHLWSDNYILSKWIFKFTMNEAINQTVMRVCHYTKTIFYKLLCPNAHFPCPGPVQSHASREIICYSRIKKLSKNGSYNAEMNCATRFIVKSFHHCSIFNKKKKTFTMPFTLGVTITFSYRSNLSF